jgi:transposase
MLNGIIYVLRTGVPWRDLPACFGKWTTVYSRFRRWCANGLFARMLAILARGAQGRLRHLDCSHIKLHQDGANPPGGQAAQAMGRTKGGLNTKLAAVVDARGHALAVCLASGPRNDQYAVLPVLGAARSRRLVGDKGFDSTVFRARLRAQRSQACIPPRRNARHAAAWHRGYYRQRHHVENFFGRIKRHRRVSTRYDKLAETFLGFVQLAAVLDWLTH